MEAIKIPMGQHNKPVLLIKTNHGRVIHALSVILAANFQSATMIVLDEGIFIQESHDSTMIFECKLHRDRFLTYQIPKISNSEENPSYITIGFSTADFKTAADKIGKTDTVEISIHPSNLDRCKITTTKGNSTNILEKSFNLIKTSIGDVVPPIYQDHIPTVTILVASFKSVFSAFKKSKNALVVISAQKEAISINDEQSQIINSGGKFGNWDPKAPILCSFTVPLIRIQSFGEVNLINGKDTIRVYAIPGVPLRLSANVASLGIVNMYLNSVPSQNANGVIGN